MEAPGILYYLHYVMNSKKKLPTQERGAEWERGSPAYPVSDREWSCRPISRSLRLPGPEPTAHKQIRI